MIIKELMRASLLGFFGLCALMVKAQDTSVPAMWNINPWTDGSEFEAFESLPTWVSGQQAITGTVNRTDYRFWTNSIPAGKQLVFSTLGRTNTFSGAFFLPGMPLFVDMRCKINQFGATPPTIAPNTVFCFYANQNSNLVVASSTECKTNTAITITTNEYYSVMIRFATDKFDIFFTNSIDPVLSLNTTGTQIQKMVIAGDGAMDDLYVSFGDPRRTAANSGISLGWSPDTVEEYVVANWLANKTTSGTYTQANAQNFYLTDTLPTGDTFTGELGIGSISYDPITLKVTVVVTLKTDASTKKQGKINGILRLKGAETYAAAKNGTSWVDISEVVKIGSDDFNNGLATYTFTLPDATCKFFLPVIKSNLQ